MGTQPCLQGALVHSPTKGSEGTHPVTGDALLADTVPAELSIWEDEARAHSMEVFTVKTELIITGLCSGGWWGNLSPVPVKVTAKKCDRAGHVCFRGHEGSR